MEEIPEECSVMQDMEGDYFQKVGESKLFPGLLRSQMDLALDFISF